ncbi:Hint domain-containing protein [Leptospira saintgironsiae]|uniref:Uncharacterized protein n=1 Tax=Leptospira saintgironsiae TaxID=2023183 RepID=A0A2M9Y823_9LEPT|nr:Hint domain-containing protein [Leptospira saintgironsiae]PJZ47603.1 hypothetical protein CH362_18380 [Leptospira saintgironsiae]
MFEKIWSNIKGEAKLVFGMSDTGQIRVNEKGQLEFDTCFVAGTLIRTKEGYTAIDKLKVGDYVLSHNEKTGILSYNKITETFIHDVPAIYKITYTNGTEVETTWNHPFYIKGEGWTQAKFLNPEQRSVTASSIRNAAILREMSDRPQMSISLAALNNKATVTPWNELYEGTAGIAKIERVIRPEKVYNIEVEGDHSYFVTRTGLLVHNYEVNPKLELLPSNDVKGLTTVNKEPKYQKLTMDGRTYEKVVDGKGNVSFESKLTNGEKVVLQVTPEGMIKRTTHSPAESKLWGMIKMSPKTTTEYLNPSGEVLGHDAVVRIADRFTDSVKSGTDLAEYTKNGKSAPLDALPERRVKELTDPNNKKLTSIKVDGLAYDRVIKGNEVFFERTANGVKESISILSDGLLHKTAVRSNGEVLPEKFLKPNGREEVTPEGRERIVDAGKKGSDIAFLDNSKKASETISLKKANELNNPKSKGYDTIKVDGIAYEKTVKGNDVTYERNRANGLREILSLKQIGSEAVIEKQVVVGDKIVSTDLLKANGKDPVTPEDQIRLRDSHKDAVAATSIAGKNSDHFNSEQVNAINKGDKVKGIGKSVDILKVGEHSYYKTVDETSGKISFERVGLGGVKESISIRGEGIFERTVTNQDSSKSVEHLTLDGKAVSPERRIEIADSNKSATELNRLADKVKKESILPSGLPGQEVVFLQNGDESNRKYDSIRVGKEVYYLTKDNEGRVAYERTNKEGVKESIRVASDGFLEKTITNSDGRVESEILNLDGKKFTSEERVRIADENPRASKLEDLATIGKGKNLERRVELFPNSEIGQLRYGGSTETREGRRVYDSIKIGDKTYYSTRDPETGIFIYERTGIDGHKEQFSVTVEGLLAKSKHVEANFLGFGEKTILEYFKMSTDGSGKLISVSEGEKERITENLRLTAKYGNSDPNTGLYVSNRENFGTLNETSVKNILGVRENSGGGLVNSFLDGATNLFRGQGIMESRRNQAIKEMETSKLTEFRTGPGEKDVKSKDEFIKKSPYQNAERYKTTTERAFEAYSIRKIEENPNLSASEKSELKNALYNRLVDPKYATQHGANEGLKLQMAATVENMRETFGRKGERFTFDSKVWGTDSEAKARFEAVKSLIFGAKDAAEVGNSFGSPVCKMYAGYVQGIMNGAYEGSFAQYMTDRFRTGDVDMTKMDYGRNDKFGQWLPGGPAPVLDQGGENPGAHERGVFPSYNLNRINEDMQKLSVHSIENFITESVSVGKIREGSVVQLHVDTDRKGGANHYLTAKVVRLSDGKFGLKIYDHTDGTVKGKSLFEYYDMNKFIHRVML